MIEDDINFVLQGQSRGHMKGVRRQLTHMPGSSFAATGSSTLVPALTPS